MQSNLVGDLCETVTEDRWGRRIDAERDLYPNPIMTKQPSVVCKGADRLWMALGYLKVDRLAQLLQEPDLDFSALDYYNQNALHRLCSNAGANLLYADNAPLYDAIMSLLLSRLAPALLAKMLAQQDRFGKRPIDQALQGKRFHYALAFWHRGSPPALAEVASQCRYSFFQTAAPLVFDGMCPITLEPIQEPAVLEDGSVYEKEDILAWLRTRPIRDQRASNVRYTSPLTNLEVGPMLYLPKTCGFVSA